MTQKRYDQYSFSLKMISIAAKILAAGLILWGVWEVCKYISSIIAS